MALQASKTCKVWIPLNPSMGSLVVVLSISDSVFPPFSLFLNSNRVFSSIFTSIECGWISFNIGRLFFYSDTLRFPRYHWFPIYSLGYQNLCCVSNIGGWSFPHCSLFSSFEVLSSKASSWLSRSGGPRRLTFVLTLSRTSRFHLFRPTFWLLSLLSFFPIELIHFYQAKRSSATFLGSFSFPGYRGTRPLLMNCWFPSLLIPFW